MVCCGILIHSLSSPLHTMWLDATHPPAASSAKRRATGDKSAKPKKKKKSVACGGADETLAVYYLSRDARAL